MTRKVEITRDIDPGAYVIRFFDNLVLMHVIYAIDIEYHVELICLWLEGEKI